MIIKLDLQIDIEKLKSYLEFVRSYCPPNMKKDGPWGGWSVTSSTGDVYDGWQTGEKVNDINTTPEERRELSDFFAINNFNKPTAIYNEYITELLTLFHKTFPTLILNRIRIALLKPHEEAEAYWHIDGEAKENEKIFRLHIPIITNQNCFIEYTDLKSHLAADGSIYLIEVSKKHRVVNLSSENRYHLIADIHQELGK